MTIYIKNNEKDNRSLSLDMWKDRNENVDFLDITVEAAESATVDFNKEAVIELIKALQSYVDNWEKL